MTPFLQRSFAAAALTLALIAHAQSTTSSSSSPATSTTTTTTTRSTAAPSTTTTTTSPTSVVPTNPTLVRNPSAITNPVPGPVVPPTTPPRLPAQAVDPLNNAATNVTRPLPANAAEQAANATAVPPGSTNASTALDASGNPIAVSGASIDALAAAGLDVALDPTATVTAIRRADRSTQQAALAQVRTRIDATSRALTELRAQARATGVATVDSNFDQAAAEIRTREDLLRDALREAGSASSDEAWRQAQSQIATHYQAYAEAVRRAQQMLLPRN